MARCSIHQKSRLGNYTPKRRPRRPDEVLRRSIAVSAGIVSASVQYVRNIRSKQRPAALTSTLPSTQLSPHNGDMPQPQKSRMPCWRPEAPVLPFTPCRTLLGEVSSSLTSATNASSPVAEPRCRVAALSDLSGDTRPTAYLSGSSSEKDQPDIRTHLQSNVVTPVEVSSLRKGRLERMLSLQLA